MDDLARRLVAAPWWRWMPGMCGVGRDSRTFRVARTHKSGGALAISGMTTLPVAPEFLGQVWPDLDDPATEGCLLAMLWEADPGAMVRRDPHRPKGAKGAAPYSVAYCGGRADGFSPGEAIALALLGIRGD